MGASSAFPRGRFPHSDWSMNAPTVGLEPLIRVRTWGVGCNFWILMQKRPNRHPGVCWPSLGDRLGYRLDLFLAGDLSKAANANLRNFDTASNAAIMTAGLRKLLPIVLRPCSRSSLPPLSADCRWRQN